MNLPGPRYLPVGLLLTLVIVAGAWAQQMRAAIDPGEVLIGELGCVSCHEAVPSVKARLASRQAPVLGETGWRLTPQWLRAYLLDPQAVKPGTVMPDALAALPEGDRPAAAEALTHLPHLAPVTARPGCQHGQRSRRQRPCALPQCRLRRLPRSPGRPAAFAE